MLLFPASAARADLKPVNPPLQTQILVRQADKAPLHVVGKIVSDDENAFAIVTPDGQQQIYNWTELTGTSAYLVRGKLIDPRNGHHWLMLGEAAWELNDTADARHALQQALQLSPNLKEDVDATLASSPGVLLDPPWEEPRPVPDNEPIDLTAARPKYRKTTPTEAKAALAAARKVARTLAREAQFSYHEIDTPHFLVFTDWSPAQDAFLRQNLEDAYAVTARQFDIPVSENVFIGKLPVYMFKSHNDFLNFAEQFDKMPADSQISGYYTSQGNGLVRLVMAKPDDKNGITDADATRIWAYNLITNFTYAFVDRYRSSLPVPTWLDDGLAAVIASSQFPNDQRRRAADYLRTHKSLDDLLADDVSIQTTETFPVMRTLVEVLLLAGHEKFLKMFGEIKLGASPARALRDAYGWSKADLQLYWRRYVGAR